MTYPLMCLSASPQHVNEGQKLAFLGHENYATDDSVNQNHLTVMDGLIIWRVCNFGQRFHGVYLCLIPPVPVHRKSSQLYPIIFLFRMRDILSPGKVRILFIIQLDRRYFIVDRLLRPLLGRLTGCWPRAAPRERGRDGR